MSSEIKYTGENTLEKLLELLKGLFDKKQDKLTAGTNITISGSTISAKDTTYTSKAAASGGTDVSLVTTGEKATWNGKGTYSKPSGGIPKTDLASGVQTSLGKADTALQTHQDISGKVDKTSIALPIGTCASGMNSRTKVVTFTDFELKDGSIFGVRFTANRDVSKLKVIEDVKMSINGDSFYVYTMNICSNWTVPETPSEFPTAMFCGDVILYFVYGNEAIWLLNGSYNEYDVAVIKETYASGDVAYAFYTGFPLTGNPTAQYIPIRVQDSMISKALKVNNTTQLDIYINGTKSTGETVPAGFYWVYCDGTCYQFRTDGKLPCDIDGDAETVNGHTVGTDVPIGAKFTDTITKFTEMGDGNAVTSILALGGQAKVKKDLTFLTEHQDISGKQDKLTAGTNITISGNTISAKDTAYSVATQSANGLMSATDKKTLDELKTTIDNLELLDTETF